MRLTIKLELITAGIMTVIMFVIAIVFVYNTIEAMGKNNINDFEIILQQNNNSKEVNEKTIIDNYVKSLKHSIENKKVELNNNLSDIKKYSIIFTIGFIIMIILIVGFFSKYVAGKIIKISEMLTEMANGEGDLTIKLPEKENGDELSQLAHSFNLFNNKITEIVKKIFDNSKMLQEISADLYKSSLEMLEQSKFTTNETKEANSFIEHANNNNITVGKIINENNKHIENVFTSSKNIPVYFEKMEGLTNSATEISSVVEINDINNSISASLEEQVSTISEISKQMNKTNSFTIDTMENIKNIGDKMNITVTSVMNMQESSSKLFKMVTEIRNSLEQITKISKNIENSSNKTFIFANNVSGMSEKLKTSSSLLKNTVDKFKI